jgi:hypothetical protein
MSGLRHIPIELDQANAFVSLHHRTHEPVQGHKFSLAATLDEKIVGVVIVGRPVARGNQDGWTLEATRNCTDGTRNACSFLYSRAMRAVRALGYRRMITYTKPEEGGASLRATGFRCMGERGGGNWNTPSRPRIDTAHALQGQKLLWELT